MLVIVFRLLALGVPFFFLLLFLTFLLGRLVLQCLRDGAFDRRFFSLTSENP